jgi:hypothetical protein
MKTMFKSILVILSVVLLSSFVGKSILTTPKSEPPKGHKQIFVNSTKEIHSVDTPLSINCFKNKLNDSVTEGFQMYTFDFEKNVLNYEFYISTEDSMYCKTFKLNIEFIKAKDGFAFYKMIDKTGFYNDVVEKTLVINLDDNKDYPQLQIIWEDGNKYDGVYSVDTREFGELFYDSDVNIFKK